MRKNPAEHLWISDIETVAASTSAEILSELLQMNCQ